MTIVHRGLHVFKRLISHSTMIVRSGDLAAQSGGLYFSGNMSAGGNVTIGGHADGRVILANGSKCPAPGTDWTPSEFGTYIDEGKTAKAYWIPLDFLKIGDEVVSYKLLGNVVGFSGETNTLDAAFQVVTKAGSLSGTAAVTTAASGSIVQVIVASGSTGVVANKVDSPATLNAVETIATDKMYHVLVTATTDASGHVSILGAEVTVNRKV